MASRIWTALLAVLLLAGCGRGGEDFTVQIARPADRVIELFGHAAVESEIAEHFPGLRVNRTAPGDNEVLYTVPGDGAFPAEIHLTFESADGGKATVVHAAVDVPAVRVDIDGKPMQLSEAKVESALHELISGAGAKLESGKDTAEPRKDFSRLLTALAIASDSKQIALAKEMQRNPEWYLGGLDSIYDGGDGDDERANDERADRDTAAGDRPVGEDPNAPARRQLTDEREQAADASEPLDAARGENAHGDSTSYEE